ncbi:MAG: prolyl oligopeptidase family serine peptidase, partial [Planctomycetota bacterium]
WLRLEHRYSGFQWLEESGQALVAEYDRDRRWVRTWLVDSSGEKERRLIWDRSVRDRYGDPGSPVRATNAGGFTVIPVHAGSILLSGLGASPQGDRPFLDRLNLQSLKSERLWQCALNSYETVSEVLARDASRILTRHETATDPPNYFVRTLPAGASRRLTDFQDPAPELQGIRKQLVTYKRDDGVQLSATLYLPPGYQQGKRLPLVVWAYPREFNDPRTAGQVSGSPHRFTRPSGTSHLFLLTEGYAIMDRAAMPVVGDPETVNDTFIEQIVASAKAAIDKAQEMGVADSKRVGVGGHSYGAFMTANLLAHSDLFRAGIARSGAYNRTLTPFGFQSERRTFWEAPMLYYRVSPFMHADKINEPVLLIHGQLDNNSGTFPIQSERLFHAIKGNGGTARLVMLPYESHGYRARESVHHVVAEMMDWFETHVKGKPILKESF